MCQCIRNTTIFILQKLQNIQNITKEITFPFSFNNTNDFNSNYCFYKFYDNLQCWEATLNM